MGSKYNKYAVRLDQAFKEAREKCFAASAKLNAAQEAFNEAKKDFGERYTGERGITRARTAANLKEAQEEYRSVFNSAWESFFIERNKINAQFNEELYEDFRLDPEMMDKSVMTMIESRMCNPTDFLLLGQTYEDNNTMLRYLAKMAERESANSNFSTEEQREFANVAVKLDPKRIHSAIKQKWDTLSNNAEIASTYKRVNEGVTNPVAHKDFTESMLRKWDDIANIGSF